MGSCVSVQGKNPDSSFSAAVNYRVPFFGSSKTNKNLIPPTPVKEKPANVDVVTEPTMTNSVGYKFQVSPFNAVPIFSNNGSKDGTFFDSQAWLDSDCESDFYSVNGDFTPSRGSTPVHGSGTPRVSRPWSPQLHNASPEGKLPFNSAFFEGRVPLNNETGRSRGSRPLDCSVSAEAPQSNGTPSGGYDSLGSSANLSPSGKRKRLADLLKDSAREGDNRAAVSKYPEVRNPTAVDLPPKSAITTYNSMSSADRTPYKAVNLEREKQPQCCLPRFVSSYSHYEKKSTTPPAINVDA